MKFTTIHYFWSVSGNFIINKTYRFDLITYCSYMNSSRVRTNCYVHLHWIDVQNSNNKNTRMWKEKAQQTGAKQNILSWNQRFSTIITNALKSVVHSQMQQLSQFHLKIISKKKWHMNNNIFNLALTREPRSGSAVLLDLSLVSVSWICKLAKTWPSNSLKGKKTSVKNKFPNQVTSHLQAVYSNT